MPKALRLTLILLLTLLSTTQVTRAQFGNPTPYLQVTADKAYYYPGDSGTLSVDIKDTLAINIAIYNITVNFPWRAYINGHWDGNQTITLNAATGQSIASGAWLPTVKVSFIEPSDSRYFLYPYYYGATQGQITVWASGVGPSGGAGSFSTPFLLANDYAAGASEMRFQTYIQAAIAVLIGVMTVAVTYYVRTSLKLKRASLTAPPPSSPNVQKGT